MIERSGGVGRQEARSHTGTWTPYVFLARALADSGIFTLRLGGRSVGEHLAKLLSRWQDARLVNSLRAIVPLVPLYRLALHSYEPETTRLFRRLLQRGMTVVDLGAEIGHYTVISAMEVGRAGRVYSFEPDPHSTQILRQNVQASGYQDVVTIVPAAVTSGDGKTQLYLGRMGFTNVFRARDPGHGSAPQRKESIEVETVSLDAYFANLGWPRIDVVKMDIEGAERLALAGMKGLVVRNPHLKLVIEFCPWIIKDAGATPEKFCDALLKAGFMRFWAIDRELEPVPLPKGLPRLVEMALKDKDGRVNLLCDGGDAS